MTQYYAFIAAAAAADCLIKYPPVKSCDLSEDSFSVLSLAAAAAAGWNSKIRAKCSRSEKEKERKS